MDPPKPKNKYIYQKKKKKKIHSNEANEIRLVREDRKVEKERSKIGMGGRVRKKDGERERKRASDLTLISGDKHGHGR